MGDSFADALMKSEFKNMINEETIYKAYENISDFKVPFGTLTREADSNIRSEHKLNVINGINYIRNTAKEISLEEFTKDIIEIGGQTIFYQYLKDHIDKVKIINQGKFHASSSDDDFGYRDTEYGFSDVIFYFTYDKQVRKVTLNFDKNCFTIYQDLESNIKEFKAYKMPDGNSIKNQYDLRNSKEFQKAFLDAMDKYLIPISEFIPLYISDDYVMVSETKKNKIACLGYNIKQHKKIIEALSTWFNNGGYIKDENFYYICRNKNTGELYLKKDPTKSPKGGIEND